MATNKVRRVIIESAFAGTDRQYARVVFNRHGKTPVKFFHRPSKSKLATIYQLCRDMVISGQASNGDVLIYPDGSFSVWYEINGAKS